MCFCAGSAGGADEYPKRAHLSIGERPAQFPPIGAHLLLPDRSRLQSQTQWGQFVGPLWFRNSPLLLLLCLNNFCALSSGGRGDDGGDRGLRYRLSGCHGDETVGSYIPVALLQGTVAGCHGRQVWMRRLIQVPFFFLSPALRLEEIRQ